MVWDILINYGRVLSCTKVEEENASHEVLVIKLFFSASNPPFCTLLCDAKAKNLQTTFLLWKLSFCQIPAIGVQEEDQESG